MSVSALCKYFVDLIISVVLSVDNNCNSLYTLGLYIYGLYIKIITFINKVIYTHLQWQKIHNICSLGN